MVYYKQLDSIRAIAVFLVLLCHWVPANHLISTADLSQMGAIGVNTFFVLSGFLITRILIENKNQADTLGVNKFNLLKTFYLRRALRIFPVYYLLIFILFVFVRQIKTELWYSVTYTINFYFFDIKHWSKYTTHFWSLAVEEQFYLVWPLLVLFLKKKYLIQVIACFIAVGIITQLLITDHEFGYLPTYTCLDSFGLGALLAWLFTTKPQLLPRAYKILSLLAGACLVIILATFISNQRSFFPERTLHSIVAAWLIMSVIYNGPGSFGENFAVLENKFLVFIGKISYGMYLFHLLIPVLTSKAHLYLNKILPSVFSLPNFYLGLTENFILLIITAWLSWKFFENPILKLKKYTAYQNDVTTKLAA